MIASSLSSQLSTIKIVTLGDGRVGKTSLILKYVKN